MYQLTIKNLNLQEYAEIPEVVELLKQTLDKFNWPNGTAITLTQGKAKWVKSKKNSEKSKGSLTVTLQFPNGNVSVANAELDVGSAEDIVDFITFQLRPDLPKN